MPRIKELHADSEYVNNIIDPLQERFEQRILDYMEKIRATCNEVDDWLCDEPQNLNGDDFRWTMTVWTTKQKDENHGYNIDIHIPEARQYGDDPPTGVNFAVDIVRIDGLIVGGLTPYNYTPQCWVDACDTEAVEERFTIIENADVNEIVALIEQHETKQIGG